MKYVEHLTLLGNSVNRNIDDIYPETIDILKAFQVNDTFVKLKFPKTDFEVQITTCKDGAVFDIQKNGVPVVINYCCFQEDQSEFLINVLKEKFVKEQLGEKSIAQPKLNQWIYTVIITTYGLSLEEILIIGEIEFYIYYSLYLGQKKS